MGAGTAGQGKEERGEEEGREEEGRAGSEEENNAHIYGQLLFGKGGKNSQRAKDILFSQ